jgi:hypothetical protein
MRAQTNQPNQTSSTTQAKPAWVYHFCIYVNLQQLMFIISCVNKLFLVSDPLCLSSSSALQFFNYSFLVHHPVNRDGRHLLAHAMASEFTVAW